MEKSFQTNLPDPTGLFLQMDEFIRQNGFTVKAKDHSRPWGGFYALEESDAPAFAATFFKDVPANALFTGGQLSPKFLLVAPGKRLSWQYHHRRAEWWKVIGGSASVARSMTDEQGPEVIMPMDVTISLACGERHRLIGRTEWGIVAEIWQHTDPANPSDESDIVRLQDDFGR